MQTDEVWRTCALFCTSTLNRTATGILLLLQPERSESRTAERLSSRLKVSLSLTAAALACGEYRHVHRAKVCFSACGRSAHRRGRGSTVVA